MNPDLLGYAALAAGALLLLTISNSGKQSSAMVADRNPLGCVFGIIGLIAMLIISIGMIYVMVLLFPGPQ